MGISGVELLADDLPPICDLLGQTDAVFAPVRSWSCGSASNAWHARKEYREVGLRWDAPTPTAAGRKARQRWLESAAERGLIERPAGGGVYSVRTRLTEPAELAARRVCGLVGLYGAVLLCLDIAEYEPGAWVAETPHLGPIDHRPIVEICAYPALVRGWLSATSTTYNCAHYRLEVDPDDLPDPDEADDRGEYVPAARAAWHRGLTGRLAALAETNELTRRELGYIPLSACHPPAVKRSAGTAK